MKPEQIRAVYASVAAATEAEARTDPAAARAMWDVTVALGPTDPSLVQILIAIINERVGADDAFALLVAGKIIDMMSTVSPPRTPRGKPGKAKAA